MTWVITILGIVMLVILHELGHFAAAKAVGMRVERFSLFFPPTLFKVKRGETEYAIGAIPAGGYVKITGMNPEEIGDLHPDVSRRAYYNQAPWKRIVVILAGPAVNILIAFVLFAAVLLAGNVNGDTALSNLSRTQTLALTDKVAGVQKGAPAQGVLSSGDRIVSIDGTPATPLRVMHVTESHRCAGAQVQGCRAATPVRLVVERAGQTLRLTVYPRYSAREKRALIGFVFGVAPKQVGVAGAAGGALGAMWGTLKETLSGLGRAFTSQKARGEVHSIIGITEVAHETVTAGAGYALVFLGFFSLALAILNLFPFLPLDGGHIAWTVAEKLRGRRVSLQAMYRYSSVGILLMLFLVINGFSNDIGHLAG
jgi:regulator of sigma E protease